MIYGLEEKLKLERKELDTELDQAKVDLKKLRESCSPDTAKKSNKAMREIKEECKLVRDKIIAEWMVKND